MKIFYTIIFLINFSNVFAQEFTKEFQKFLDDYSFKPPKYDYKYDRNDKEVTLTYFLGTPDKDMDDFTVIIDSLNCLRIISYLDDAYQIGNSSINTKEQSPGMSSNIIFNYYKGDWCNVDLVMSESTPEYFEKEKGNKARHRFILVFRWWELEK